MADKHFDRNEAEALLPVIGRYLGEAVEWKKLIEEIDAAMSRAIAKIMALGGSIPPSAELGRKKALREQHLASLQGTLEEIQQTGCVVKDLDMGLVDFPSMLNGQEVYLCWKLGEKHIAYYHGMDEGYSARKPLDELPDDEPPLGGSRPH